jgi:4-amino-4-deoxy-L-arabinose transferase-like glycosyltransferase
MPPPAPCIPFARLVLVALVIRFAAAAATLGAGQGTEFPDSAHYVAMARHIASGAGWHVAPWALAERPPLYPAFLALHLLIFGKVASALATQAVLGALTCAGIARIGERLWGARAGALAGLLATVYPALVFATTRLLSEGLYVPLVVAQLLAAVEAGRAAFGREGRRAAAWAAAAGALGGLGALTHAGHLLFPAALAAAFAFAWWRARQLATPDGAGILAAGILLLAAAHVLAIAPWTIRNAVVLGAPVPVTSKLGNDLYEATFPGATGGPVAWREHPAGREAHLQSLRLDEAAADRFLRAEAWHAVREDPLRFARLALVKAWRLWSPVPNHEGFRTPLLVALVLLSYGPVAALAALGALRLRRGSVLAALLPALPLYITLLHLVFIGSLRYRIPAEPVLLLLAAYRVTGPDDAP